MSKERFNFIIKTLRFDKKLTRMARKTESKLAPIKTVWETFINNCTTNYKPSSYCAVDEQLGRLPIISYKPRSNKLVTLLSSIHSDVCIHEDTKKPEIIHIYNQTKGALDTFNQMCQHINFV